MRPRVFLRSAFVLAAVLLLAETAFAGQAIRQVGRLWVVRDGDATRYGQCVVVSVEDGHAVALTAAHNVKGIAPEDDILVYFRSAVQPVYRARVLETRDDRDIAVLMLEFNGPDGLGFAPRSLATSTVTKGKQVWFSSWGYRSVEYTRRPTEALWGSVAMVEQQQYAHDALPSGSLICIEGVLAYPGDSGGALLNQQGQVVGIIVAVAPGQKRHYCQTCQAWHEATTDRTWSASIADNAWVRQYLPEQSIVTTPGQ